MLVLLRNSSFFTYKQSVSFSFALIGIFSLCFISLVPQVFAADLVISPASGSYNVGQTFTTTLQVDPKGDSVNAVEAGLTFDASKLAVVSVSKTGSVFSLWTTEPAFSNTAGTVTFGGGSPTPFTTKSTLLSVTFKTLAEGAPTIAYGTASVLAADGRGTDVLKAKNGGSYTVAAATTPVPTPTPTPAPATTPDTSTQPADSKPKTTEGDSNTLAFGDPPRAPEVGSVTFLDPEIWYNKIDGAFTWTLPFDVNGLRVELATSSENKPTKVSNPPVETFAINKDNAHDGIQYLSIQYKNQVGWGGITNRKIQIDTTPPKPFTINVRAGTTPSAFPLLEFEAQDDTSGIEKYELTIAAKEPVSITPDEAKLGYLVKDLEDGTYTVKVVAFDKAGNKTESSVALLITAGWTKPSDVVQKASIWSFLTRGTIFAALLILIIIFEFVYLIFERKQFKKKEEKLRKETKEIQDQMEKIFSALRDEIYDQINNISVRPRLSQKEKEAVEGLNQALEVSETLIEKEINDVKKILK